MTKIPINYTVAKIKKKLRQISGIEKKIRDQSLRRYTVHSERDSLPLARRTLTHSLQLILLIEQQSTSSESRFFSLIIVAASHLSRALMTKIKKPRPAVLRQRAKPSEEEENSLQFPSSRPSGQFHSPVRRRSFFQRYLCEIVIFLLTLTGSSTYMYLNMEVERENLDAQLPERMRFRTWDWPPIDEQPLLKDQWHLAVVTLILPDGRVTKSGKPTQEDVSFQTSMGHEHKLSPSEPGHVGMSEFFLDHDVYGIIAWHPADHSIKNITKYNKQAHLDLLKDMKDAEPMPDTIYEMDVENRGRGLELGWAATYSNLRSRSERDDIEAQMLLLGRMYGQPAIYKWWCHQYGPDARKDVSIIQEILPTAAATWNMKTSGPVYRVRYEHRKVPYQVPGEYHHTPRQRLPQADNTKKERKRNHQEFVREKVRQENYRREENRKYERKKKEREEQGEEGSL